MRGRAALRCLPALRSLPLLFPLRSLFPLPLLFPLRSLFPLPLLFPLRSLFPLPLLPFLLLLLPPGSARAAAAETSPHLPAPKNVEVFSYNFQSWLRWSPVLVENGSVLYTVQYKTGSFEAWSELGCAHTPQTQCPFPEELQRRRWTLVLRVRAELGAHTSPWALSPPFVAEANTTLGPPRVNNVSASPDSLLISVSPPFPPEPGDFLQYLVSYWENTTRPAEKQELIEGNTLFQIGNLKESTLYCFSIRVQLRIYSGHFLQGEQRAPECHSTALSEATRAGYIVALFLLGLLLLNLLAVALLLLWRHHRRIKHWAQPPLQIPSHFEEFLREPGLAGLEELYSPAEEEPLALLVEGRELQGEEPLGDQGRAREGPAQAGLLPQHWPQAAPVGGCWQSPELDPGITGEP